MVLRSQDNKKPTEIIAISKSIKIEKCKFTEKVCEFKKCVYVALIRFPYTYGITKYILIIK